MQITQTYHTPSTTHNDAKGSHFNFSAEQSRGTVSLHAMVNNSLSYARMMLALRKVVKGDWRTPQKDHSAYQAWVQQKYLEELPQHYGKIEKEKLDLISQKVELQEQIAELNKKVQPIQQLINRSRSDYWNYLYKHEKDKWMLLDPVISVHPDCVIFEAFSIDESSYGRVSVPMENLETFGETTFGTTNIDFSQKLADEIYRVRSYRPAWLKVAYEQVELSTNTGSSIEKKIDLPSTWVRGFLQVQSASTLPGTMLTLDAQTLNEVLAVLTQQKAKRSPRSLRFQLTKNKKPSIIIEPWGIEVQEHTHVYTGDFEGEIKIWGRRRLSVLTDVLPHADKVQIKLLGTGMPSYWSVEIDGHRFDLGLSGWTANDWAKKANFDLLASAASSNLDDVNLVETKLMEKLAGTPEDFSQWLMMPKSNATFALQELCKNGQAMYDPILGLYRRRQLLQQDIKIEKPEEDERLKYANQLLKDKKVAITATTKEKDRKTYDATVEGKNTFKPKITIDADGRINRAECTCGHFRQHKLRQGPCSHILAATLFISK